MRSSPWFSLALVLPLLLLASWGIFHFTSQNPLIVEQPSQPTGINPTSAEPTTGEGLVPIQIEIQASPGHLRLALTDTANGQRHEWQRAENQRGASRLRLRIPAQPERQFQLSAQWTNAPTGPLALTLTIRRPRASTQQQTFWAEADETGQAQLNQTLDLPLPAPGAPALP